MERKRIANLKPIFVNFESSDEDRAVWLDLPLQSAITMQEIEYQLLEGDKIWITDGDIEVMGIVQYRNGRFVAMIMSEYMQVPIDKPYHVSRSGL